MAARAAKAMTPTSVPGNKRLRQRGFTLIELLVVMAMVAIASAAVSMALRDPAEARLEREAERLVALFESARAESRAAGINVLWAPLQQKSAQEDFRFQGLPERIQLPRRWLVEGVAVDIINARSVRLGPEPMIGAQQVLLRLGDQRLLLSTDGLAPFSVGPAPAP